MKNVETRRYDRDEYFQLEAEVLSKLRTDFPARRVEAIRAYSQKPSFGDMDILFESDYLNINVIDYLKETFNSKEVVRNSHVYSFEYNNFQIDLILTSKANFDTSFTYFAYNDLGNLMRRVSHKLGFKYGHECLSLIIPE